MRPCDGAWAAAVEAVEHVATDWRGDRGGAGDEPSGWVDFVCTNVSANVAQILLTVADRFSLETTFPDCKQIVEPARAGVVRVGKYRCIQRVAWGPSR